MGDVALLSFDQLLQAVSGTYLCDHSPVKHIHSVVTDSRNACPFSLFVPLLGEKQDGHAYIPQAMRSGSCCVFVDKQHTASVDLNLAQDLSVTIIVVNNTLRALQDAAAFYVALFPSIKKIAITGSSGKTTTKEIAGSLLSQKYSVIMNEGNLNSETGLPLSVFKIRKEHQVGLFEMGMNRRGEISEIARVLFPDIALITNVGTAHIGILGSEEAIAEEKKAIFSNFSVRSVGFVPESGKWTDFLRSGVPGTIKNYGPLSLTGYRGYTDLGLSGTIIHYEGEDIRFPLPGPYNLLNALAAISLALEMGLTSQEIRTGLESVQTIFGRSQIITGEITVLLDCYNANPDSMKKTIEYVSSLDWKGKKIMVLGSMLELGDSSREAHREICEMCLHSNVNQIHFFGADMVRASAETSWNGIDVFTYDDMDNLKQNIASSVTPGDLVFIKGSRGMALERIVPALQNPEGKGCAL